MLDEALTARIAAAKRRLLDGGLLQEVEWGVVPAVGERTNAGAITYAYSDRLTRSSNSAPSWTVGRHQTPKDLMNSRAPVILDPVAINDDQLFRFGDPLHTYSIKAINGLAERTRKRELDISPKYA